MAQPSTPPTLLSRQELREALTGWHRHTPPGVHPEPFPGPLADKVVLDNWLNDIKERAVAHLNLHPLHWTNAALSWIPETLNGTEGFREKLLKHMREKRRRRELEADRFWRWNNFKRIFSTMCDSEVLKHRLKIGAAAVGSAVIAPAVGVAALGLVGFTSGGVAAGSLAASIQSVFYGGATGGAFSILQGIGARAAFPAIVNVAAGVIGGGAAAAAAGAGNQNQRQIEVGDIGDDP